MNYFRGKNIIITSNYYANMHYLTSECISSCFSPPSNSSSSFRAIFISILIVTTVIIKSRKQTRYSDNMTHAARPQHRIRDFKQAYISCANNDNQLTGDNCWSQVNCSMCKSVYKYINSPTTSEEIWLKKKENIFCSLLLFQPSAGQHCGWKSHHSKMLEGRGSAQM